MNSFSVHSGGRRRQRRLPAERSGNLAQTAHSQTTAVRRMPQRSVHGSRPRGSNRRTPGPDRSDRGPCRTNREPRATPRPLARGGQAGAIVGRRPASARPWNEQRLRCGPRLWRQHERLPTTGPAGPAGDVGSSCRSSSPAWASIIAASLSSRAAASSTTVWCARGCSRWDPRRCPPPPPPKRPKPSWPPWIPTS